MEDCRALIFVFATMTVDKKRQCSSRCCVHLSWVTSDKIPSTTQQLLFPLPLYKKTLLSFLVKLPRYPSGSVFFRTYTCFGLSAQSDSLHKSVIQFCDPHLVFIFSGRVCSAEMMNIYKLHKGCKQSYVSSREVM